MTEEQFIEITKWQDKTFPDATSLSKLCHLKQEIKEVTESIIQNSNETFLEFADCFLLLYGAAKKVGMDYSDICVAIEMKMKINKERKWGKPDSNGVVNHKK